MNYESIKFLRLQRQHMIEPVDEEHYDQLFKNMSPVQTQFWIEPGSPPELLYRCEFDDALTNDMYRRDRTIIKGRFQGGNVAYCFLEDLPLFMAAYRKPIKSFSQQVEIVLNILKNEGAMDIDLIKEISGLLSKEIAKALQKLQKAFIVYEDQVDSERTRAFYILEDEFSNLDFRKYSREEAINEVIKRFIYMNVFVTIDMIKSYTKFTNKDIKLSMERLFEKDVIIEVDESFGQGFILTDDVEEIKRVKSDVPDKVFILDLNDYLVKSNELILKDRFGRSELKTLHYVMKKGEIVGRVLGYFRYGPNDLEDIEVDVENDKILEYKHEIIKALEETYSGQETKLKKYCGKRI